MRGLLHHPTKEHEMRLTLEKTKRVEIPNDPDGGYINIRLLSLNKIAQIESKCNQTGVDANSEVRISLDPFARENKVARACLVGWGNLFGPKGEELKFNHRNLILAEDFVIHIVDEKGEKQKVRFLEWVDSEHSKFYSESEDEAEDVSKN